MASPFIAGIAVAHTGYAGRYSIQAWQAFKARPPTARLRRFYDGGFQPAMTRREAALILGIRGSKTAVKENRAPRQLTSYVGKTAGRNSAGRITIFHRGGGAKRLYRRIDLKRSTSSMGIIERIEYDPNRSSRIALVRWEDSHHHFQKKCSAVDEFVPPCKILEPTTATTRGLFSLSSLSSGVDQRKVACPPRLAGTYAMVGPQTGMLPELKSLFASNDAESKKTCARDVFLSAFSTPSSNRKIASLPPSSSLNFPRITVAGAKPVYFASQMREKDGGKNTFSMSEIRKWHPNSILWAHRIKRKAAVSWQSFRWQDTLGFAEAADSKVSKPETDNVSSHGANTCKATS